jgi:hypothetical protein
VPHFRFRAAAVALQGREHVRQNRPCADAVGHAKSRKRWCLMVLADGAGSARFGSEGARLAVSTVLADSRNDDLGALAGAAHDAIDSAAGARALAPDDFATTLLIAKLVLERRGKIRVTTLQVGDGVIVAGDRAGASALTVPRRGEHVNETVFITSPRWSRTAVTSESAIGKGQGVLVMSDGPMSVLYDIRRDAVAPACGEILHWGSHAGSFRFQAALAQAMRDVVFPSTPDDLSLACCVAVSD